MAIDARGRFLGRPIELLASALVLALMIVAPLSAQSPTTPSTAPAQVATPVTATQPAAQRVPTLGQVRALVPEQAPVVDLYRFRNPVTVESNRFDRGYRPSPSVKEVSEGGGYLMMGLHYGIVAAANGIRRLTGGREQIQTAIARPPPLSNAQLQRAEALCAAECGSANSGD